MKVAFVYGFTEGKMVASALIQALQAAGFRVISDATQADIIIAHSGGCFLVPQPHQASCLILVNPPFWPQKPLWQRSVHKFISEPKNRAWFKKTLLNSYYLLAHPVTWARMYRATKAQTWPSGSDKSKTFVIRNHHDSFTDAELLRTKVEGNGWEYRQLAGGHDDLWLHPKPYIQILRQASDSAHGPDETVHIS